MPYTPFVSLVAPVRNAKKIARVHHGLACGAVVGVVVVRAMGEDEVGLVFAYLLRHKALAVKNARLLISMLVLPFKSLPSPSPIATSTLYHAHIRKRSPLGK